MAKCPICNNQIPNNQTVCPYCETIVNKHPAVMDTSEKKSINKTLFWGLNSLFFVLLCVIELCVNKSFRLSLAGYSISLCPFALFCLMNVGFAFKAGIKKGSVALTILCILMVAVFYAFRLSFYGPYIYTLSFILIKTTAVVSTTYAIINAKSINDKHLTTPKNNAKVDSDSLRELKELYDTDVITEQEFTAKKRQVLGI